MKRNKERTTLKVVRELRTELANARRRERKERDRAFLSCIQRDYYSSLTSYLEESVIVFAKTEEQLNEAKQNYKGYRGRIEQRYEEEAKPFLTALYGRRWGYLKSPCHRPIAPELYRKETQQQQ